MDHEEAPILKSENQNDIEMAMAAEETIILPAVSCITCNFTCTFAKENDALESEVRSKSAIKLSGLIVFYLIIMAVEIVGGIKANSLAVITDAAHLLTDVAGSSVSLFTVWASGWRATPDQSFGYGRLEVFGALLSVQLIWLVSGILCYEAVDRIFHKQAGVKGGLMFATAAFGFITNLVMVTWLGHDHSHHSCHGHGHGHGHRHDHDHDHIHNHIHSHSANDASEIHEEEEEETKLVSSSPVKAKVSNINIQGAYLHVMADLIQSVGVMIAGAVIWAKPLWLWVDLVCTIVFCAFVICSTVPMVRDIFSILMDRTPRDIDLGRLKNGLKCIKGVVDVHDLHVWAITVGKLVLTCHIVAEPGASSSEIHHQISDYCEKTFRIHHVTIQIE